MVITAARFPQISPSQQGTAFSGRQIAAVRTKGEFAAAASMAALHLRNDIGCFLTAAIGPFFDLVGQ